MNTKVLAWATRLFFLIFGLFIFAFGSVMIVKAHLGANPWNVFHLGLTHYLPLTIGQASQLTGLTLILLSLLLGIYPGVATVSNMLTVGFFMDLTIAHGWVLDQQTLVAQWVQLVLGLVVIALGSGIYMSPKLGAGPRDSLMLALNRRFGWSIARSRTTMEVGALVVGWILGGEVGLGTVVFSVCIGRLVAWSMRLCRWLMDHEPVNRLTLHWPKPSSEQSKA